MEKMIKQVRAEVPGKLYIAGEYAVVEGAPAVIVAVNHYLRVTVCDSDGQGYLQSSQRPGLRLSWQRTAQGPTMTTAHPYQLVEEAMRVAEAYAGRPAGYYELRIDSDLDNGETGLKYGLGSSGAVTIAVIRALLAYFDQTTDPLLTYKLAVICQLRLGLKGSFGDLAASSFGGWLAYRCPDRSWLLGQMAEHSPQELAEKNWPQLLIEPLTLPAGLELLVGWTRSAASTEDLVGQMSRQSKQADKAKHHQQFLIKSRACLEDMIAAFQTGQAAAVQAGLRHNRQLLSSYAREVGLGIETPALKTLIACAEEQGAAAKTSGAGGGDCGICLVNHSAQAAAVQAAWQAAGITSLALQPAPVFAPDCQIRRSYDPASQSQGPARGAGQSAISKPVQL